MNSYIIETKVSIPEKTAVVYQTLMEGDSPNVNEILYSLLHSHITLLQKELETLEIIMKRHPR